MVFCVFLGHHALFVRGQVFSKMLCCFVLKGASFNKTYCCMRLLQCELISGHFETKLFVCVICLLISFAVLILTQYTEEVKFIFKPN